MHEFAWVGGRARGLNQAAGVINPGTDSAIQSSLTTTTTPQYVQWYANANPSRVNAG